MRAPRHHSGTLAPRVLTGHAYAAVPLFIARDGWMDGWMDRLIEIHTHTHTHTRTHTHTAEQDPTSAHDHVLRPRSAPLRCDALLLCADDVRAVFPVPSMRRWVEYYEEYCRAQRAAPFDIWCVCARLNLKHGL